MTFEEKIKDIMMKCENPVQLPEQRGFSNGKDWACSMILSAVRQLIVEAKPRSYLLLQDHHDERVAHNDAIDEFEQNLLQALEEK